MSSTPENVRATILAYLSARRQLETASDDAANAHPMQLKQAKVAALSAAATRYAEASQALERLVAAPPANQTKPNAPSWDSYNTIGHTCPTTGRTCITVVESYDRLDSHERAFYLYHPDSAASAHEPWLEATDLAASEERDAHGRPMEYSLTTALGVSTVRRSTPIYMQLSQAERLAQR